MRALASANKDSMRSLVPCLLASTADEKGKRRENSGSSMSFLSFQDLRTKHFLSFKAAC